ncbi:MAG TPA: succinylglutamate desuccinylase/aspartoacylase family protein [Candidatus Saccharimonadales bacterium]|nr:succinylglutamate desuccinylase/aspartoacylase family protein [Candidatus Saccharimonadales bacterium]
MNPPKNPATNKNKRILIVGAQHGDERLGPRLNRFLKSDTTGRFKNVDYLCGNPRAFRRNVRFTETDLNRSYDTLPAVSYEEKRAQKILRIIAAGNYDYVLDIHTSRADVGRFFLATHLQGPVARVIGASNFGRVAIMPPHIAGCSLIGQVPQAISVEYDRRLARTQQTLKELVMLLENLLAGKTTPQKRDIFYVKEKIPLHSSISYDAKNFELCPEGFYPVIFARNSSYTAYKGFAAYEKDTRTM